MFWSRKKTSFILSLEYKGKVLYSLDSKDFTDDIYIGRSEECAWSIGDMDSTASNKHALLSSNNGMMFIEDLKSRNGVIYKGQAIRRAEIKLGDVFQIGACVLKAEAKESATVVPDILRYTNDRGRTVSYTLKEGVIRIGFSKECEIRFNNKFLSSKHIAIKKSKDGSCWLKDLGSQNGTKVNGEELRSGKERLLKDNDVIQIADIDMTFWDGTKSHTSFHLLTAVVILVVSLLICLGCYWMYMQMRPSSEEFIVKARQAARVAEFSEARKYLSSAALSKDAAQNEVEVSKLERRIGKWEDTHRRWEAIKAEIPKGDVYKLRQLFSALDMEFHTSWDWNESEALTLLNSARTINRLVESMMFIVSSINDSDCSIDDLRNLRTTLDMQIKDKDITNQPYISSLVPQCIARLKQADSVIRSHDEVAQRLRAMRDIEKELPAIREFLAEKTSHAAQINQKYFSRMALSFENITRLRQQENQQRKKIWNMDFDNTEFRQVKVPTTSSEFREVDDCCRKIVESVKENNSAMVRLKFYVQLLTNLHLDPVLDYKPLLNFGDDLQMAKVLECDCLAMPLPSVRRTVSVGKYDEMVGIEYMYAYWRALGTSASKDLHASYRIPLMSQLEQTRKVIEQIVIFLAYVNAPKNAWLKQGKLLEYVRHLERQLELRDQVVSKLQLRMEDYSAERQQFIILGIIGCLNPAYMTLNNRATKLKAQFIAFQQKMQDLNDQYNRAMPQEAMTIMEDILRQGLPGDPVTKRMWSMRQS